MGRMGAAGRMGAGKDGERPAEPRLPARGLVLQPACRTTLLELFRWAPERLLLLGALHHPHSPGMHPPALGRDDFSIPFFMRETGRCVIAELFYCFPHYVPQQSPIALGNGYSGCKVKQLTLQEFQGCTRPCYYNSPPFTCYSLPST